MFSAATQGLAMRTDSTSRDGICGEAVRICAATGRMSSCPSAPFTERHASRGATYRALATSVRGARRRMSAIALPRARTSFVVGSPKRFGQCSTATGSTAFGTDIVRNERPPKSNSASREAADVFAASIPAGSSEARTRTRSSPA